LYYQQIFTGHSASHAIFIETKPREKLTDAFKEPANTSIWIYGRNSHGQLGLPATEDSLPPTKFDVKHKIVQAAVGRNHTLLLTHDGKVLAAGANTAGQCGQDVSKYINIEEFIQVPGIANSNIVHIAAGGEFSALVTGKCSIRYLNCC